MPAPNPYSKYQNVRVSTVHRGELLVMVYDALIRYLEEVKNKMIERDFSGKGLYIDRAYSALNELRKSLNFEADNKLADSLNQLYFFMSKQLTKASLDNDVNAVDSVIRLLIGLRSAWKEASEKEKNSEPKVKSSA